MVLHLIKQKSEVLLVEILDKRRMIQNVRKIGKTLFCNYIFLLVEILDKHKMIQNVRKLNKTLFL